LEFGIIDLSDKTLPLQPERMIRLAQVGAMRTELQQVVKTRS
jgi:hypothetical protein